MVEVAPSPAAEADIVAILEYGASRWGRDEALAFALAFKDAYDLLERHPLIGRERPELGADLRSWAHRGYLLYYRFDRDVVTILRILHGTADAGTFDSRH